MRLPDRFFLTGTDTDVGKTLTAAALCAAGGWSYWKPIQAGTEPTTDTQRVQELSDARTWPEAYRLAQPASPNQAARNEGLPLDVHRITPPPADRLLVEGAGGWMVPLSDAPRTDTADLVRHLSLPALVVARSGLGTLNHTRLTVRAIQSDGVVCLGVILVGAEHADNEADLTRLLHAPVLGRLPHVAGPITATSPAWRALVKHARHILSA